MLFVDRSMLDSWSIGFPHQPCDGQNRHTINAVAANNKRIATAISNKAHARWALLSWGCLTMTYFRTGNPYYHRRAAVSRSCSGWEGVVPAGYGRQALTGNRG